MSYKIPYRAWTEINVNRFRNNLELIRDKLPAQTKLLAMLKTNAYGHGAVNLAKAASDKMDMIGVATHEEALELREAGVETPILILYQPPLDVLDVLIEQNIQITLFSWDYLKKLAAYPLNNPIQVHVEIDTGMGRTGFFPTDAECVFSKIEGCPHIQIKGVFSHFSESDKEHSSFSENQITQFKAVTKHLPNTIIKHMANSKGIENYPESHFDMVRLGLDGYKDVLSLKTHVVQVRTIPKGYSVSYSRLHITKEATTLGTIAIGYGDGLTLALREKGKVLINGTFYPIIGRICMDYIMVDLGDQTQVKEGDVVTLIGEDKGNHISKEDYAAAAGISVYQVSTLLSKRLPRILT